MTVNDDFEAWYRNIYGSRWKRLRESLLDSVTAFPYTEGLALPYRLNRASVLAAESLRLDAEGLILDACAAPGGKSLVIASRLKSGRPESGPQLLCNELSAERRRRLSEVLDRHLFPETRSRVRVSGFDAAAQGGRKSEQGRFCAILLDAPCSSEEHVLKDQKAYMAWKPGRPRFLAQRQWALLSSCFLLLEKGGSLVYSTCALNPEENEGVAGRLLKKYSDTVEPDPPAFPEGEASPLGRMILPDTSGMGPMYVARFRKKA
ncbi:MAG: 16S rRNA methyltransferase [Treponema sp.]|jgi:16S rRNA (cytosine1407-C5)-methyltransferase|nr:16S rRNA methyltransferase [Treponema sp.]